MQTGRILRSDRTIRLWELPGGRGIGRRIFDTGLHALAFSPDGTLLGAAAARIYSCRTCLLLGVLRRRASDYLAAIGAAPTSTQAGVP